MTRYCIFSILTISIWISANAQNPIRVKPAELDSLAQLIKSHTKEDSVRVKLLTDYANLCFYDLDFVSGLKAANEARSIAREIGYQKGEGLFFTNMAIFHRGRGETSAYYKILANQLLNQYTNLGVFGNYDIQHGARDQEKETILTNLDAALASFKLIGDSATTSEIHWEIAQQFQDFQLKNDIQTSRVYSEHKKLALDQFLRLNLSWPALQILKYEIYYYWNIGNIEKAKELEVEAANIYLKEPNGKIKAFDAYQLGILYGQNNRASLGLEYLFNAEELLLDINEKDLLKNVYRSIRMVYSFTNNEQEKALEYAYKELELRNELNYYEGIGITYLAVTQSSFSLDRLDSIPAEYQAYLQDFITDSTDYFYGSGVMRLQGRMLIKKGKYDEAIDILKKSIERSKNGNDTRGMSTSAVRLAIAYKDIGDNNSAIQFALSASDLASRTSWMPVQITASDLLSQLYEASGNKQKAYDYLKFYRSLKEKSDELNNKARLAEVEIQAVLRKNKEDIASLERETELRDQENKTQQLWILSIGGALLSVVIIAIILVRNNRQKQKANTVLASTLSDLKSTQSQLIQSEKMASLGELTAGIAHEIQNPLNFVNNFSEVSTELVDEMNIEIEKGNNDEAKLIAQDLKQNLEKINHHGKRAGDIVKGMLQHSRSSSGIKEPTDINALCDEYLRLSYHGLRAKDKSFNAKFETDFDTALPKINIVPQDIGRVILNLITNAFYAVTLRLSKGDSAYEPTVTVHTKREGDYVLISVKDNGNGIPDPIKEKIFQPFFTTKPTGQGTGLGLSLSYDIVKAHGGELKVESKEGEGLPAGASAQAGSEFVIKLPV